MALDPTDDIRQGGVDRRVSCIEDEVKAAVPLLPDCAVEFLLHEIKAESRIKTKVLGDKLRHPSRVERDTRGESANMRCFNLVEPPKV